MGRFCYPRVFCVPYIEGEPFCESRNPKYANEVPFGVLFLLAQEEVLKKARIVGGSRDERKRRERAQTAKVSKNYEKTVDKNKKITYNTNSKVAKATAERHSKKIPSLFVTGFCL